MINKEKISLLAKHCLNLGITPKELGVNFYAIRKELNNMIDIKIQKHYRLEDIDNMIRVLVRQSRYFYANKWKTIFYLMYFTGVSRDESLYLKRENFDLERCSLKIDWTNRYNPRTVFYPVFLRDRIREEFNKEPEVSNAFNITEGMLDHRTAVLRDKKFNGRRFKYTTLRTSCRGLLYKNGISNEVMNYILGLGNGEVNIEIVEQEYKEKIGG